MNVQVVHAPVHTPEQVREIIDQAHKIADDFATDSPRWFDVFREACRLLGQRASVPLVEQPPPMLLPRMDVPRGRG